MKLFEYQVKEIFKMHNIKIPRSYLVNHIGELDDVMEKITLPCVLKSQVLQGGRGKAGLIKSVKDKAEMQATAKELFESKFNVNSILVEEVIDIAKELYLSITIEPQNQRAVVIACDEGGIDIEALAKDSPDKLIIEGIDIIKGIHPFQCKNIAYALDVSVDNAKQISQVVYSLYQIFKKYDAELVEINPLFITNGGKVIAGDGKLSIDDNSMFRQKDFEKTIAYYDNDIEYEASLEGIPYIQFDGDISLMCAGAGLTTTVYDLINYEGGSVANYLEFGGPNYKKAEKAMSLCMKNESKVILVVTFGTIARADIMAEGIVEAIKKLNPDRPIVTCIRGTNEEQAIETLKSAGLECIMDTEEAVRRAVEIAKAGV